MVPSFFSKPRPKVRDEDKTLKDDHEVEEAKPREYDTDLDHADDWMIPKDDCEVCF